MNKVIGHPGKQYIKDNAQTTQQRTNTELQLRFSQCGAVGCDTTYIPYDLCITIDRLHLRDRKELQLQKSSREGHDQSQGLATPPMTGRTRRVGC